MKILKKVITTTLIFLCIFFIFDKKTQGQQTCQGLNSEECKVVIQDAENSLNEITAQKNTLSSQIEFMDTQVYLTTLRIQDTQNQIAKTESEIETLGGRIEGLNSSLDYLTKLLFDKIKESYKRRDISFFNVLLDSDSASTLVNQLKYAQIAQENDRRVAFQLQQAKQNFEDQKDLREKKKTELDKLKASLAVQNASLQSQRASKQRLLNVTQNDEKNYQLLLSRLRSEYAAIQGIIAGEGTETQIRDVKKGEVIASVISGASCNSSGSHLHFSVLDGGTVNNPFNYLKNVDYVNYTGGDPWSPSGNWDWPVSPTIEFNQGYGESICATSGWCGSIYSFHNGIDIAGSSFNTYAVEDGALYRGNYAIGCTLPYTKVIHKDSNITTLYLHTYTQ
ncbi:MAG: hypothetical protein ABH812_02230 [bacterium]